MRVIITGSRHFNDRSLMKQVLRRFPAGSTIVNGAAPGADQLSTQIAEQMGFTVKEFEVTKDEWNFLGLKAGPIRNQRMVDAGADICFTFPDSQSKGTWDCAERALKAGIKTFIVERLENSVAIWQFDGSRQNQEIAENQTKITLKDNPNV